MKWKKFIAVFLAAGVGFAFACAGSPAETFAKETGTAYEVNINITGTAFADTEEKDGVPGEDIILTAGNGVLSGDGKSNGNSGENGSRSSEDNNGSGENGSRSSEDNNGSGENGSSSGKNSGSSGQNGSGTGTTPGEESNSPSDSVSGGDLGKNGSGTGDAPAGEADLSSDGLSGEDSGETGDSTGTTPGGEADLPGGGTSGEDLGETSDNPGTTPGGEADWPGDSASGEDLGETGDNPGTTPEDGGLMPWEDNVSADPGTGGSTPGSAPGADGVTPGQSGTPAKEAGSEPGAGGTTPGLPANIMPGTDTIGAIKDSMEQKPGIMEQTEAAQRIITGDQESGYAIRARQEKADTSGNKSANASGNKFGNKSGNTSGYGSSHYVRPGSYSVDAYAPQVGTVVASPVIKKEFRFWTVAKEAAIAKKKLPVREEMKSNSRTIGTLPENGVCYILKEEDGGWIYVESGTVRGFVRKELLISGLKATMMVETREFAANLLGNMTGQTISEEEILKPAEEEVPATENEALTYRRATVYQTIVDKDPALAAWDVAIREEQSEEAREIGTLKKGGICYVITDRDQDWVYVESGDVRGFVKKEDLLFSDTKINEEGKTLKDQIEERGESTYSLATELVPTKENKALYYSLMSIRSGVPDSSKREAVLSYAAQFIGNPYVWGGTDPVHGADCSGFVQTIYKQFGYTLPRTAAQQALCGEKIPVSEALLGDLIFYGNASGIYHVVICAGGDQTLEAKGRKYGIVSSTLNQKAAVWAIRVMDDADALEYDIPEGLGTVHSYMGWQKVTNVHSQQYAFRNTAGMTFDKEGFAVVDNRYVIACTDTFGAIGDYVDFYQEDGTKIPCIIGDFKNEGDAGCNKWGHMNGRCIIEFVVDQYSWYPSHHANPGTASCHPEWHQNLVKAERVGSFYE